MLRSMSDETTPTPEDAEVTPHDAETLKTERDELSKRVEVLENRPAKRRKARRAATAILVILSIVALSAAVPGVWLRRTLVNTDSYVALVEDLPSDPAVQEYLARTITDQVFLSLGVQDQLETVLADADDRLTFLAGPISQAVEDFVQEQVQKLIASPEFATLWTEANRFAHGTIVTVLGGESGEVVSTADGQVVLNLLPIVNAAIEAVSGVASELVGQDISIPPIDADTVPDEAIAAIETATGVDLPDDFGQIVLVDSDQLGVAQDVFQTTNALAIALGLLVVLSAAAALWASTRKRRTLVQIASAWMVVLVVERRLAISAGDGVVANAKPENAGAAEAVVDTVVSALLSYTEMLFWILALVLIVALLTGPYPWAVRLRGWVVGLWAAITGMAREADRDASTAWVASHRDLILGVDAAIVVLLMLVFDLSIGWFLLILGLGGLMALGAWRLADAEPDEDEDAEGASEARSEAPPAG
jgi:hypothetical protein